MRRESHPAIVMVATDLIPGCATVPGPLAIVRHDAGTDTEPLFPGDLTMPANRRVAVTLRRKRRRPR